MSNTYTRTHTYTQRRTRDKHDAGQQNAAQSGWHTYNTRVDMWSITCIGLSVQVHEVFVRA